MTSYREEQDFYLQLEGLFNNSHVEVKDLITRYRNIGEEVIKLKEQNKILLDKLKTVNIIINK